MQALLRSGPPICSWPLPSPETTGHSRTSLGQSLVVSLLLSLWSWCTQAFVCALQVSVSSVLCKFWWFYGGVNGLCHTQVYCTQSPCPCMSPLLTHCLLCKRHSDTVLAHSLWGLWVLVRTRFVWALQASLEGRYSITERWFSILWCIYSMAVLPWWLSW